MNAANAIYSRVNALSRSPTSFSLAAQGVSGLIQMSAFFSLHGQSYLAFSSAFLFGNVLSLLVIANFENIVLAGGMTRSVRQYLVACWSLGLASSLVTVVLRTTVPSFITFCAWGVCVRLFLAWANRARPSPLFLAASMSLPLGACLLGTLPQLMVAVFLMLPIAAQGSVGPAEGEDDGFLAVALDSLRSFAGYLPHTVSGLVVGYVDRFAALQIVGGLGAEIYLRTLQICSWSAFLIYPVVFGLRRAILQAGALSKGQATRIFGWIALALVAAMSGVLLVIHWTGRMPRMTALVLALTFLGVVCSQCYQVVSTLNFVARRFAVINRITLTSAGIALVLVFSLVPATKVPASLAFVLFMGWSIQLVLTARSLRSGAAAPSPG